MLLALIGCLLASRPALAAFGAIFSAGFTSDMVLKAAPSAAAIYGLVYSPSPGTAPTVVLSFDGIPIAAEVLVKAGIEGSGDGCDKQCWSAGHLTSAGAISPCASPSCSMGCIFAHYSSSSAACAAQCANASNKCSYTAPGSTWEMDMCEGSISGGCPAKGECEAGCEFAFASDAAQFGWRAVLPPQPAGVTHHTISVQCTASCLPNATDDAPLERVVFGDVFYCRCVLSLLLVVAPLLPASPPLHRQRPEQHGSRTPVHVPL